MLTVALAQIAPVWLDRPATTQKILDTLSDAHRRHADLVVFGEALLPGYPWWLAHTGGAAWELPIHKELYAHYAANAVSIQDGYLDAIGNLARQYGMAVYLGIVERPHDRGGHSLYCSLVYIDPDGEIGSVHRKLQPTYDERLTWSPGDGHGLRTHQLYNFTLGGLNCWENWMPLPRAALYAQGENVHVAVWPGSDFNTRDITRFIARESRSYVLSVSGLMRQADIPPRTPYYGRLVTDLPETLANGGSCIAGPAGQWIVEPVIDSEQLIIAELDLQRVFQERQNFDPVGHYARPDVTSLSVDRRRQTTLRLLDGED